MKSKKAFETILALMTESFKEERSHNEPRYKSAVKKDGVTCTTTINDSDLLGWVYAQSVKIP